MLQYKEMIAIYCQNITIYILTLQQLEWPASSSQMAVIIRWTARLTR
jgi:hypothetical protein